MTEEKKMNLADILPELKNGWQHLSDGSFHKTLDNEEYDLYIAPCNNNSTNDGFSAEIGLYSKSPFKNPEKLKRKFAWIMAEFLLDPPISYEERADGWYMFVTDTDNFKHYIKFAKQTIEDD